MLVLIKNAVFFLFQHEKKNFGHLLVAHQVILLTLLLLNTTCPVLANSVDEDQLASEEAT